MGGSKDVKWPAESDYPFLRKYPKLYSITLQHLWSLTLRGRAPIRTLSETIIDRDLIFFSGGSCVFLGKITFSTHSGQTAP